jgi:hypothetical protein
LRSASTSVANLGVRDTTRQIKLQLGIPESAKGQSGNLSSPTVDSCPSSKAWQTTQNVVPVQRWKAAKNIKFDALI